MLQQASPACHTNHYGLGGNGVVQITKKPSSTSERYNRASELIAVQQSFIARRKQILGRSNGFSTSNFPIAVLFPKLVHLL